MKILVLGAGGIGGMVGGRLAQQGADVTFLVREKRQRVLEAEGLHVESPYGNFHVPVATKLSDQVQGGYDLVLLACKAYDLDSAIETIRPAMSGATCVLPLLNGIGHIKRLNDVFGAEHVLGGSIKMQVTLSPDGVVRQLSDWQTITFGEQDGCMSARVLGFHAVLAQTGIESRPSENILRDMWMKMVHLATVAGLTCLMRANIGEIARTPDGIALAHQFLHLNADIAAQAGHPPDAAFLQTYLDLLSQTDSAYEASMLRDLEKGGRIESEQILGFMLEACRKSGLNDSLHAAAYTHAKAFEQRRQAGRLALNA